MATSAAALLLLPGLAFAGPADEAARRAAEQHGGRVLKVEEKGDSYRIKLLLPSGQVKVVRVPNDAVGTPVGGAQEGGEKKNAASQSLGGRRLDPGREQRVGGGRW